MLVELPARQARYLSLPIAGYSYDEIVAITGTSYTNVTKHLACARATIKRLRSS